MLLSAVSCLPVGFDAFSCQSFALIVVGSTCASGAAGASVFATKIHGTKNNCYEQRRGFKFLKHLLFLAICSFVTYSATSRLLTQHPIYSFGFAV